MLGNYALQRKFASVHRGQRRFTGFEQAQKIGIVYDATEESNRNLIKEYVRKVRSGMQKEVIALGYVDKKELDHNFMAKLGLDFFCNKNLNAYMLPKSTSVTNFIGEDFDILINFTTVTNFPIQYITAVSKAKFKIGKYSKSNTHFLDFMIQLSEKATLQEFLEQLNHYLSVINKSDAKRA